MERVTYQEAFHLLHQAGFTEKEIDRLYHFRQTYRRSELDQPPLDLYRLRFVQWLVATGRLTEQLSEGQSAPTDLSSPQRSQSVPPHARFLFALFRRKESYAL